MTTIFEDRETVTDFKHYREQWESALLAALMAGQTDLNDHDRKQLLKRWFEGLFNGIAHAAVEPNMEGNGELEWQQTSPTQFQAVYTAPYGLKCYLAQVYEQPNGSWGALVIAGVKDEPWEAIAAAEWAISKLSAA